ncbi:MAG: MBL fold metallo-hydrolase [Candidatus Acidiferrales bacterium]
MTKTSWKISLFGLLGLLLVPGWAQAQVTIEYIAHACFLVQSPAGIRVVIDPYNSHRWLGYSFPAAPAADAVLITHPHYDHDAGYYWGAEVPTIRAPGRYAVGDVRVEGIRGKHADPYGTDFGQINTIWMLEVGGLRIAHLGDNGPLSRADIRALGRVDVLMIPIDGQYHILSRDAIEAIRSALRPRVTIPMHYRIPSLSDLPESLGPIEPWLGERRNVTQLETNRTVLAPETLPLTEHIMVFPPSPAVQPWSEPLRQAWAEARGARELLQEDSPGARQAAVEHLRRATALAPEVIFFWWQLGEALNQAGQQEEAIRVLERGLAGAGRSDWEHRMKARALLADLYGAAGNVQLATKQYRLILAGSYRTELRRHAADFLRVGKSRD